MPKFTDEEWAVDAGCLSIAGQVVALPFGPDHATADEKRANVRLASASRELYKACQRAFHVFENDTERKCEVMEQIRVALAKADGK